MASMAAGTPRKRAAAMCEAPPQMQAAARATAHSALCSLPPLVLCCSSGGAGDKQLAQVGLGRRPCRLAGGRLRCLPAQAPAGTLPPHERCACHRRCRGG